MTILKTIKFWIFDASRGYSIPTSILNWLVIFVWCLKYNGNMIYGFLALIGIIFAHLGVNLFDDYIDYILKVPKQECKSVYLTQNKVDIKTVLKVVIIYFSIALLIGLFFTYKFGYPIVIIATIAGFVGLLYPKLNNFAMGEFAVGFLFGPLLFTGVAYVMTENITIQIILLSIPVTLFTVNLLNIHALMDYNFDKISGKKTLSIILGSKEKALIGIFSIIAIADILTILYIIFKILPISALLTLITLILTIESFRKMQIYIKTEKPAKDMFMKNFILARNISVIYNLFLVISILIS